jgi:hypothetical protein
MKKLLSKYVIFVPCEKDDRTLIKKELIATVF